MTSPSALSVGDRAVHKISGAKVKIVAVDVGPGDLVRVEYPLTGDQMLTAYENLVRDGTS